MAIRFLNNHNQQPTTNHQQPTTNNQQPTTTNNQQPTTNNHQPPTTNNQQPTSTNQQPTTNNNTSRRPRNQPWSIRVFTVLSASTSDRARVMEGIMEVPCLPNFHLVSSPPQPSIGLVVPPPPGSATCHQLASISNQVQHLPYRALMWVGPPTTNNQQPQPTTTKGGGEEKEERAPRRTRIGAGWAAFRIIVLYVCACGRRRAAATGAPGTHTNVSLALNMTFNVGPRRQVTITNIALKSVLVRIM